MRYSMILALLLSATIPMVSLGQNPAREAYIDAESLAKIGKFKEAIARYEEAYRLAPRAMILFHMGAIYEEWGKYDDAIAMYKRYLDEAGPQDEERQLAEERVTGIREELSRTGLYIDASAAGAEVLVDGVSVGRTPIEKPISVTPGNHKVLVRKEGLEEYNTLVVVPIGKVTGVKPVLIAAVVPPPPPPPPPSPPSHLAPYLLFGLGGGFMLGGASLGIWALADNDCPDEAVWAMHGILWPGLAAVIIGGILYAVEDENFKDELMKYRLRYGLVVGGSVHAPTDRSSP